MGLIKLFHLLIVVLVVIYISVMVSTSGDPFKKSNFHSSFLIKQKPNQFIPFKTSTQKFESDPDFLKKALFTTSDFKERKNQSNPNSDRVYTFNFRNEERVEDRLVDTLPIEDRMSEVPISDIELPADVEMPVDVDLNSISDNLLKKSS